ncbi:hypothetical protein V5O48_019200, partial [Marasmius crinis-equi]
IGVTPDSSSTSSLTSCNESSLASGKALEIAAQVSVYVSPAAREFARKSSMDRRMYRSVKSSGD